jgi:predicted RecB family nuclease
MRLPAGVLYNLHRPSTCELRVYLWGQGIKGAEAGPYEKVIERLGMLHERRHLESLGEFVNLAGGTEEERVSRTIDAVESQATVIYQGTLKRELNVGGKIITLVGQPDFLLRSGEGYLIRDAKLSRRITDKDHPEILAQVRLYGLLFEKTFGRKAVRLEIFAGSGELVEVSYVPEQELIEIVGEIAALLDLTDAPFSPVGWTKCGSCGYRNNCWDTAVEASDVALVPLVDQGMTKTLRTVVLPRLSSC